MLSFTQGVQIRWADIDANRHLRHSVYYDYGASVRMALLSEFGLTTRKLEELMIGPVLFREEAIFKREIVFEDKISITAELIRATEDFGRWSLRHRFMKNGDTEAALLHVDGAWIDMTKRKLAVPGGFIREIFEKFPRSADFEFMKLEKK